MTVLAFLLFVLAIPMSMALGARHLNPIRAIQSLLCLAGVCAVAIGVLLRQDIPWLAMELVLLISLISMLASLMFGFAAWRTPEMNDTTDETFNRFVEPYLGRPVDVFGWAHAFFDWLPSRFFGMRSPVLTTQADPSTERPVDQEER